MRAVDRLLHHHPAYTHARVQGHENVLWVDVSVDGALVVYVRQGICELSRPRPKCVDMRTTGSRNAEMSMSARSSTMTGHVSVLLFASNLDARHDAGVLQLPRQTRLALHTGFLATVAI